LNAARAIILALMMLKPEAGRVINVRAQGQSVHIRTQLSRQYRGEPLRFDDGAGRTCYDQNGDMTIRCVEHFYGASVSVTLEFDGHGVMSDTITSVANHPKLRPIPPTTRTAQTGSRQTTIYRVFGYDESLINPDDVERFRTIQAPLWVEVREDIGLNDRPLVSLYWYQTLDEIRLERVEPH